MFLFYIWGKWSSWSPTQRMTEILRHQYIYWAYRFKIIDSKIWVTRWGNIKKCQPHNIAINKWISDKLNWIERLYSLPRERLCFHTLYKWSQFCKLNSYICCLKRIWRLVSTFVETLWGKSIGTRIQYLQTSPSEFAEKS